MAESVAGIEVIFQCSLQPGALGKELLHPARRVGVLQRLHHNGESNRPARAGQRPLLSQQDIVHNLDHPIPHLVVVGKARTLKDLLSNPSVLVLEILVDLEGIENDANLAIVSSVLHLLESLANVVSVVDLDQAREGVAPFCFGLGRDAVADGPQEPGRHETRGLVGQVTDLVNGGDSDIGRGVLVNHFFQHQTRVLRQFRLARQDRDEVLDHGFPHPKVNVGRSSQPLAKTGTKLGPDAAGFGVKEPSQQFDNLESLLGLWGLQGVGHGPNDGGEDLGGDFVEFVYNGALRFG